jgi:signal transduction histidine kinase
VATCQGVLIGGIAAWQVPVLQNRERFLKSFGEQAASHIQATTAKTEKIALQVDSVAEEYRDASRRVVHEANNSLSIIKNYLGVLDSKLGKHELAGSELSILHEEIGRVGQIIRGFVDPEPSMRASVADVNRVVREVVHLFHESKSVPASVKIAVQTLETPSEVTVSVASLKQILVNLVKNSIEAMPAGGEIQILNNGHVNRDGLLYTELCVRDNGPGITPRILELIFSPGQTTKQGEHHGLGLSIVHGLVKQSQGLITCRSSPKGTAFEILLPLHKHS